MKWKNSILIAAALLFTAVNIFLIIKDDAHQIDRVTLITDWTEAIEKDMFATLETDGILDYTGEEWIFLDESHGYFHEFHVAEGDIVKAGDALYSYEVENYYPLKSRLDEQKVQLKSDIKAVEQAIKKIKKSQISQDTYRFVYPDDKEAGTFKQNTSSAEMLKQQYIIEKEKELAEKQAQLKSVESQWKELTAGGKTITVDSPYEGMITGLSPTLENPLITIASPKLYVIGELTEKERMEVDTGMVADIRLKENGQIFQGSVTEISTVPKNVHLKGNSAYPFHVAFSEEDSAKGEADAEDGDRENPLKLEELLQGYHADITITLKESLNTVVVPKHLIVEPSSIWLMTGNGELQKQSVEMGIEGDKYVEVNTNTIEKGDWLAVAPKQHFRTKSTFLTPLQPSNTNWKAIFQNGARKRSILIGLLGK